MINCEKCLDKGLLFHWGIPHLVPCGCKITPKNEAT